MYVCIDKATGGIIIAAAPSMSRSSARATRGNNGEMPELASTGGRTVDVTRVVVFFLKRESYSASQANTFKQFTHKIDVTV